MTPGIAVAAAPSVVLLVSAVLCAAASPALAQDAISYRVVATNRTSTMQKGMTVGKTLVGGNEVASILRRPVR